MYPIPERIGDLVYKMADTPEELLEAKRLHHDVYLRKDYIDNPYPNGIIEDQYAPHSDYITAIYLPDDENDEYRGKIVGVMRMIRHSEAGLPALNNFDIFPDFRQRLSGNELQKTVELSALAVRGQFNVAKGLYRFAIQYSDFMGDVYWLAVLDERLAKAYIRRFKFFFEKIGKPKFYIGDETTPYIMSRKFQREMMPEESPELAEFLYSERLDQSTIDISDLI